MKSKSYHNRSKNPIDNKNYWDAFINHLDTIYFAGASELLDKKLIAFEYDAFKSYHTG